jgi:hypothetical protein
MLVMICLGSVGLGCSPKNRAVKGSPDGTRIKKVIITLENIDAKDLDRPNNIYELSGCIDPTQGTLDREKSQLSVSNSKLKLTTACNLSISNPTPEPTMAFEDGAKNILYKAQGFEIYQTPEGQLIANARLQKTYRYEISVDQKFTWVVPVTFPNPEPGKIITGLLQECTPSFAASSAFKRKNDSEGDLEFYASIPSPSDIKCNILWIGVDGVAEKYYFKPDGGFKFNAKPKETSKDAPITVVINPFPQSDPTAIFIETSAVPDDKRCDFAKQIFNTSTGQCEAKP